MQRLERDLAIYEIIHGETVMLARPAMSHSNIAVNISRIFSVYLKGRRCKVFFEPEVHLDENNLFVPDIVVVCDREIIKYNGIYGSPDLVVEIASPTTAKRDRGVKKDTYEAFGVKEYWLVNPGDQSIEVYHLKDGRFFLDNTYHVYTEEEWDSLTEEEKAEQQFHVKVSLYDDLLVDVKEVFEE